MIIKLHGTSGAGKSTVARGIMEAGRLWECYGPKMEAYKVEIPGFHLPITILGKYNSQCGGCDTLLASEQIELLHKYAPEGHVFYEGLLASEYYGKLGTESERYGDGHIFAFLYTPIDICIERIKARRALKGNVKPLDESNTRGRVKKIERLQWKLEHEFYRPTRILNWENPVKDVLEIFRHHDQHYSPKSDAVLDSGKGRNTTEKEVQRPKTVE